MPTSRTQHPTPYPELNDVLRILVDDVRAALGDVFVGAYLQGSFAVGDFDEHSDVDFIVAVRDELTDEQVAALQIVHARTYGLACEWAQHLEGSYFPTAVLRDHRRAGTPLWFLDHGSKALIRSEHCNTVVVRWVVRERGIELAGPPASALVDPVPVAVLRREIAAVIDGWGKQILDDPAPYGNRFYQGFIVLSYCRMLHDLIVGVPGSKRAGAAWAQANLDSKWSGLIERAWAGRPNPAVSSREPADPADFERTLEFVRYIVSESARYEVGADDSTRRSNRMATPAKNTICLWYDRDAEDAARFYAETFPDSSVSAVHRAPGDFPSGKKGDVLTVEFTVMGLPCLGLNGGPTFKHNEAFSFQVATVDQAETDRYWNAIVGNGGEESACGWCKDRWGVSWQITPIALTQAITDPDPAAAKRAFDAMMEMGKIDIATIEAARRG